MDGLTGYQARRLELADMIRLLLPVAHAYQDEQREHEIRTLLTRLAAGRFQLAVIGQFSRGKTTLMNALLGAAYLPTGALPMTSVITTVRYGTRSRALIRSHAGTLPVEVPVSEVARFVARASADRAQMQVASVEVEIPAELLRLGFEFVDTPGIGSALAANTATTLNYLPEADAVVFVTGYDSALTRAETEFLATAAGHAGKLFVIVNKRDLVSESDAEEVTNYVRRWASANLPAEPPVFGISALQALDGVVSGDARQLAESRITALRNALTQFLAAEQGRVALYHVATAAAVLVMRQERDLTTGRLGGHGRASERFMADFGSRMSELEGELAAVASSIATTTSIAAGDVLAERGPAWEAELGELLGPASAIPAADTDGEPPADGFDALLLAGRQVAGGWLDRRTAELREVLVGAAAEDIGILLGLARSPREVGAAIAGIPAAHAAPAGWTVRELPQLTVPVVNWTVPNPPARHRHHRGRAGALAAATLRSAAVTDFCGRARAGFEGAAADWARRLGDEAQRHANAEAVQVRHYLAAPQGDQDLAMLAELAVRLGAFCDSLAAWEPDADSPAAGLEDEAGAAPSPATPSSCAICGQLEAAQTEYLIHRQFLLATSEAEQVRHAGAGGFCPLHTWQYAHFASPVGIAAGNARLASQLAGALRAAETGSHDPRELAQKVRGVVPGLACPACEVLAKAELRAAAELAAAEMALTEPPRLCVRHLALVLGACSSLSAGQAMTSALAASLARSSENMRAYALKREALRRGMITADEATAYTDALRLLSGQPALARPAPPE
jgi:Dynamin family